MDSKNPHTRRKQKGAKKWEKLRSALTRTMIESECLPSGVPCYVCRNEDTAVRRVECGPFNNYFLSIVPPNYMQTATTTTAQKFGRYSVT